MPIWDFEVRSIQNKNFTTCYSYSALHNAQTNMKSVANPVANCFQQWTCPPWKRVDFFRGVEQTMRFMSNKPCNEIMSRAFCTDKTCFRKFFLQKILLANYLTSWKICNELNCQTGQKKISANYRRYIAKAFPPKWITPHALEKL